MILVTTLQVVQLLTVHKKFYLITTYENSENPNERLNEFLTRVIVAKL